MQTRKRAKSISFGKSPKPKEAEEKTVEKVESKPAAPETVSPVEKSEPTYAAKKVQELEEPAPTELKPEAEEKTLSSELSEKPSEGIVKEPVEPEAITPPDQFLSDTTEPPKQESIEPKQDEKPTAPLVVEPVSTSPVDQNIVSPEVENKSTDNALSGELSPTPPSSAFTLQGNNIDATSEGGKKKKNFVVYFLIVAFISFALGLAAMAAVSYFGLLPKNLPGLTVDTKVLNNMNPLKPTETPEPTVVPTVAPTEKPLDLKSYKISVLNGSGIKGKAAEVKTSLTGAGFVVSTTGNADRSDYGATQIAAKKSVDKAYLDKLEAELKKEYEVDTVSTIPSDSSQAADVIVTLGKAAAN